MIKSRVGRLNVKDHQGNLDGYQTSYSLTDLCSGSDIVRVFHLLLLEDRPESCNEVTRWRSE